MHERQQEHETGRRPSGAHILEFLDEKLLGARFFKEGSARMIAQGLGDTQTTMYENESGLKQRATWSELHKQNTDKVAKLEQASVEADAGEYHGALPYLVEDLNDHRLLASHHLEKYNERIVQGDKIGSLISKEQLEEHLLRIGELEEMTHFIEDQPL